MIEVLKDFPDNVAAFACRGRLTKADYETVLIPVIEDKLKRHKKAAVLYRDRARFRRRDRTRRLLGGNEVRTPATSIHQLPPPGPVRVSATRASSPATGASATWLLSTAIIQVRTARILSASVGGTGRPSAGAMSWRRCV